MLAADLEVLPESVQQEVRGFFQDTQSWLTHLLEQGRETGFCNYPLEAKGVIAMLQGAQLLARAESDSGEAFEQIVDPMLPI